ncbi:hypothetical protein PENTCL1PPCAC_8751, partial [Pristionchus entomophagus]
SGRCVFLDVLQSKATQEGTSKSLINDAEIGALESVVRKLRRRGFDHKDVKVIAFYEAQRKLAKATLPEGFEIFTVDSAQGREKEIVIVLTTTNSPGSFFTDEKRVNVALSRHKEALIVLGSSKALMNAEPWQSVLHNYFFHLTYKK